MSQPTTLMTPTETAGKRRAGGRFTAWPLWALAAGVLGFTATVLTDSRPPAESANDDYTVRVADVLTVDQSTLFLSMVFGYLAVACLLVFAAAWRKHVEANGRASIAAHVVTLGLVASAGILALAYGFRGALANYLPGGIDEGAYDVNGLWVFYMFNDFGAYIAWMPAGVALGAIVWMAFRERTISRWIGGLNLLYVLVIFGATFITGVPGLPGTLASVFLAITGIGLAVGRSPIALPDHGRS